MGFIAQSNFLQALGWAALNSFWQMALLWLLYQALAAGVFKSAASRNSLSAGMLLAGFGWFIVTFVNLLKYNVDGSLMGIDLIAVDEGLNEWLFTLLPWASLAYLLCLVFPLSQFFRNYRYVRIIRQQGLIKPPAAMRLFVAGVSERMALGRRVRIWVSEFVASPVTIGYLKPIILIPVAALNNLSTSQLEAILLHELSHIRRFDYLVNLVVKLIQALLYFNPFVKAFARIIDREREKACDQLVLQFEYEPRGYASALLTLEREAKRMELLLIPAFSGKKSELLMRIESILGIHQPARLTPAVVARLSVALLALFFCLSVVILSQPGQLRPMPVSGTAVLSPFLAFEPTSESESSGPSWSALTGKGAIDAKAATRAASPSKELNTTAHHKPMDAPDAADKSGDREMTDPRMLFASMKNAPAAGQLSAADARKAQTDRAQQQQVREAITLSRRVLEELKWKDLEKNIGDAMTLAQKEAARQALFQQINALNWGNMENKLQESYSQIDWNEIRKNLSQEIINIRLDSVQRVYDLALSGLAELQRSLDEAGVAGVPDTDLDLGTVQKKQLEVKQAARKLKAVRAKKIVQL